MCGLKATWKPPSPTSPTADDEHTVWFRQQILDVTGIDMSAPDDSPPPELVLDWSA